MSRPRRPILGSWLVVADCCGRVRHSHQTRTGVSLVQKGLVVCLEHFEPRHPLDLNPPGKNLRPERPPQGRITGQEVHTSATTVTNGVTVGLYADAVVPENYQTTAAAQVGLNSNATNGYNWSPPVRIKKPDGSYQ